MRLILPLMAATAMLTVCRSCACPLARDCPSYGTGPTGFEEAAKLVKGVEKDHILALAAPR